MPGALPAVVRHCKVPRGTAGWGLQCLKEPSAAGNIWKDSWENVTVKGVCCWTPGAVGEVGTPSQEEQEKQRQSCCWKPALAQLPLASCPSPGRGHSQGSKGAQFQPGHWEGRLRWGILSFPQHKSRSL